MPKQFEIKQEVQAPVDKAELKRQKKAQKEALREQAKIDREKMLKKKQATKKERKSLVKRLKETGSELKKVSWPKFSTVVKSTGIVLSVVGFFLVVLFAFDFGLGYLFDWFTGSL